MDKQTEPRKEISAGWAGLVVVAALLIGAGYFYIQSMQHEGLSTLVDWVYMAGLLVAAILIGLVSLPFVLRKKTLPTQPEKQHSSLIAVIIAIVIAFIGIFFTLLFIG